MSLCSPKPVLKVYQDRKRPEYINKQHELPPSVSGIIKPAESIEETSIKSPVQSLQRADVLEETQV